jgi:hypothetical protein
MNSAAWGQLNYNFIIIIIIIKYLKKFLFLEVTQTNMLNIFTNVSEKPAANRRFFRNVREYFQTTRCHIPDDGIIQ